MTNIISTNGTNIVSINTDDKKVAHEKNNCLIYTISLIVICLLLVVISISCHACYYYYTRHLIKEEFALQHCRIDIK